MHYTERINKHKSGCSSHECSHKFHISTRLARHITRGVSPEPLAVQAKRFKYLRSLRELPGFLMCSGGNPPDPLGYQVCQKRRIPCRLSASKVFRSKSERPLEIIRPINKSRIDRKIFHCTSVNHASEPCVNDVRRSHRMLEQD